MVFIIIIILRSLCSLIPDTVNEILIELFKFSTASNSDSSEFVLKIFEFSFRFRQPNDENTPAGMVLKGKFNRHNQVKRKRISTSFTKPLYKET